jgi:hypothetical protein
VENIEDGEEDRALELYAAAILAHGFDSVVIVATYQRDKGGLQSTELSWGRAGNVYAATASAEDALAQMQEQDEGYSSDFDDGDGDSLIEPD